MKIKGFSLVCAAVTASLTLAAPSAIAADSMSIQGKDVLSVAKNKGHFNTLAKAIEAAGLADVLASQGPITLFAPTDEAFSKLPAAELEALLDPANKDKLVKLLTYHVVPGKAISENSMKRSSEATTAEGSAVRFALVRGRVRVDEARVTGDHDAANGVVYSIDRVLMPN
jgi:uncharacterized surface protein with fasciclin (FAS1) repeats